MIERQAALDPDHPALTFLVAPEDRRPQIVTRGDLIASVRVVAGGLIARGVRPDDAVAVLAPSTPEAMIAFLAASAIAKAFPVNPLLSPEVIARQFEIAGVTACFAFGAHADSDAGERASAALAICRSVRTVIELPSGTGPGGAWASRATAIGWNELGRSATLDCSHRLSAERTAALFHTGGTTGNPKLAELSMRALAAGPRMAAAAIGWRREDRVLNLLPFFHVGGSLTITLSALSAGATVIGCGVLGARSPELIRRFWTVVADQVVTVPVMVPTSWAAVAANRLPRAPASVRGLVTGASAMPATLARKLENDAGVPMCQVFGMTELAGICTAQPLDGKFRVPAVGYAAPGLDVRLAGTDDTGAPLGLKGPNLFSGYCTAAGRVDAPANEWFDTGDLARLTEEGQIELVGRTKDVIIRSGHNIDPAMIEEAAYRIPGVIAAAAIGMPDSYAGEVPVLYIERTSREPSSKVLRDLIAQHIAEPPARPRLVIDVDQLPLTPVGKIARYRLRQCCAVAKAQELLAELPPCVIECDDPGARHLTIRWSVPFSAEQRAQADEVLAAVGLRATQFDLAAVGATA